MNTHHTTCVCLSCRNARTVAHGRELGIIATENARLPSYELKAALKLHRTIEGSAESIRSMALRLMNREDALYTDDAAKLSNVARKLEEIAADLAELTSR